MTTVLDPFAGIPGADDTELGEYSPARRDLKALTDHELALAYCQPGANADALKAEEDRRACAEHQRHAARTRRRNAQAEWYDAAYQQYRAAESACHGVLLNHRGIARGIDPFALWKGPWRMAEPYASYELLEWWQDHPRVTMAEYARQQRRNKEAELDDHLDRDAANPVRRVASEGPEGTGSGSDRGGYPVPRLAAAAETAGVIWPPRADAGRDGAVRPGRAVNPAIAQMRAQADTIRSRTAEITAGITRAPQPAAEPDWDEPASHHADVAVREPDAVMPARARQAPDPAEMLRQVLEATGLYLMDYVAFPSRSALVAVILWIAHAGARDQAGELIWWASPRLLLTSAQNGSGKSTLLDLIAILLGSRSGRMVKVTAYGLAQVLGTHHDVALPDDAQLTFGTTGTAAKEIQAVLLGGYTKGGTWVTGKSKGTIEKVFGPAAIAGKDALITRQADALADLLARSIIVRMERPDRYMPQVDEDAWERGQAIGRSLAAVLGALQGQLKIAARSLSAAASGQEITDGDGGRTAQIWRQLEAVAKVAGGPWPAALAEAAQELAAASGDLLAAEDALAGIAQAHDGRSFWDEA